MCVWSGPGPYVLCLCILCLVCDYLVCMRQRERSVSFSVSLPSKAFSSAFIEEYRRHGVKMRDSLQRSLTELYEGNSYFRDPEQHSKPRGCYLPIATCRFQHLWDTCYLRLLLICWLLSANAQHNTRIHVCFILGWGTEEYIASA